MKKFILLLCIAVAVVACRSTKESTSKAYRQEAIRDVFTYMRSHQQQMVLDSTRQLWSFYSDSAFSFHPDSGLQTISGYLLFDQTALTAKHMHEANESEMQLMNSAQESYTEKQTLGQFSSLWVWLLGLLALALLLGWLCIRRIPWPIRI